MKTLKNLVSLTLILFLGFCTNTNAQKIPATIVTEQNGEITSLKNDFQISGIYPHLTTYTHGHANGSQSILKNGNEQLECGIGALAEWGGKLYMINYAAHEPEGSEHKLYILDKDLKMEIFQGSVGGTPAARMIHQESNQLFIGNYVIDASGKIRVIPSKEMPGRLTAVARHLTDPANKVYYYHMDGALYEVDVHTLKPTILYENPLPGWHGKGAYTSQGKLVMSNNGENHGSFEVADFWKVDSTNVNGPDKNGVLAEFDGTRFKIVERRQTTDVTTLNGILAVPNEQSPLWAIGWDKRALRLNVMENQKWTTYLLPKAAYNNDPSHGWFTEWPRIRETERGKFMMDMHGMFFDFPKTFSSANSAGLKPIGSHLRYVPDFIFWNGKMVLASDETSIQGNPLAGQAQSNLWMGKSKELSQWGPSSAYGSIWLNDLVTANQPSLPFMFAGFDHQILHLNNESTKSIQVTVQLDINGTNQWTDYKTITLPAYGYQYEIFDEKLQAAWVRLVSNEDAKITATFHYTDKTLHAPADGNALFKGLAEWDYKGQVSHSKLYSNKNNFHLTVFSGKVENDLFTASKVYELDKFKFTFREGLQDKAAKIALKNKAIWTEDAASVIVYSEDYQVRLPKGKGHYSPTASRNIREVESEREIANIHGTFYEVPLFKVGSPALLKLIRPISTHNRQITDFNTWNGLLFLSGVKLNQSCSKHIIKNQAGDVALWMGGIDDIWNFGKPVGEGGPWKESLVKANVLSDMYLMTGYDKKKIILQSDTDVKITLMLTVSQYSESPVTFKTFEIKAGQPLTYEFPVGFSAHWAQVKADKDCVATAWFVYE